MNEILAQAILHAAKDPRDIGILADAFEEHGASDEDYQETLDYYRDPLTWLVREKDIRAAKKFLYGTDLKFVSLEELIKQILDKKDNSKWFDNVFESFFSEKLYRYEPREWDQYQLIVMYFKTENLNHFKIDSLIYGPAVFSRLKRFIEVGRLLLKYTGDRKVKERLDQWEKIKKGRIQ